MYCQVMIPVRPASGGGTEPAFPGSVTVLVQKTTLVSFAILGGTVLASLTYPLSITT